MKQQGLPMNCAKCAAPLVGDPMPELCGVFASFYLRGGQQSVLKADLCASCADETVAALKVLGLTEQVDPDIEASNRSSRQ